MVTDLTEQRHYQELQRTQEALRASERAAGAGPAGRPHRHIRMEHPDRRGELVRDQGRAVRTARGRIRRPLRGLEASRPPRRPGPRRGDRLRAVAERTDLDTEFRIVRPDGETRWITSKGKVFYGATASRCACSA